MAPKPEKAWETIQVKAFTHWVNSVLESRSIVVEDLTKDFQSGLKLIAFFEALAGKSLKKRYDKKPKMRIQRIQNLHLALLFAESALGVSAKSVGIGAEDIEDGHLKLILGLLYTLYRHTRIATITQEGKSSEEALLLWVKSLTEGYDGVEVGSSFRDTFSDGLAFAALLDAYDGGKTLPFDKVASIDDNKARIAATFGAAETAVGVPTLLDADEVAEGQVDERSLVLYTSLLFHAFAARDHTNAAVSKSKAAASELEQSVGALQKENAELRDKLKSTTAKYDELATQNAALRTALDSLAEKFDAQADEMTRAKIEFKKNAADRSEVEKREAVMREKITLLKQLLDAEQKDHASASATADAATSAAKSAEAEVSRLRHTTKELRDKCDEERKAAIQSRKQLRQVTERSSAERSGVLLLRDELERHINDLNRWRRYLLYDKEAYTDFGVLEQVVLKQVDEVGDDFNAQLAVLQQALAAENDTVDKMLKSKKEEYEKLLKQAKKDKEAKDSKESKEDPKRGAAALKESHKHSRHGLKHSSKRVNVDAETGAASGTNEPGETEAVAAAAQSAESPAASVSTQSSKRAGGKPRRKSAKSKA